MIPNERPSLEQLRTELATVDVELDGIEELVRRHARRLPDSAVSPLVAKEIERLIKKRRELAAEIASRENADNPFRPEPGWL